MSKEELSQNFQTRIKSVIRSWQKLEENLDDFREEISHNFFKTYPNRIDLFKNSESSGPDATESNLRKKLYKHSVAIINCMEAIVDFIRGNEESKPILFVLGKQHKRINVSEKMFLEMKDTICDIIKKRLGDKSWESWLVVLEYIYINYVFPGMYLCGGGFSPRFYSVYAPDFKEPILNQDEITETLKTQSAEEILAVQRKPPPNSFSCSVFYHPDVNLFINYIMRRGEKEIAQTIVRDAFTRVKHIQLRKYNNETDLEKKEKILLCPLEVFLLAVKNASPLMWYTKVRKSGSWFKVPVGITEVNGKKKALKWLIEVSSEGKSNIKFKAELANELVAAANYEGKAIAKKLELHKMCEANRGYMHYWWA